MCTGGRAGLRSVVGNGAHPVAGRPNSSCIWSWPAAAPITSSNRLRPAAGTAPLPPQGPHTEPFPPIHSCPSLPPCTRMRAGTSVSTFWCRCPFLLAQVSVLSGAGAFFDRVPAPTDGAECRNAVQVSPLFWHLRQSEGYLRHSRENGSIPGGRCAFLVPDLVHFTGGSCYKDRFFCYFCCELKNNAL